MKSDEHYKDWPGPKDYMGTCKHCGQVFAGSKADVIGGVCYGCRSMNPQTPNPPPQDVESAAEAIYDLMRANDPEGSRYPWAKGGNSDKQQEARRYAIAALAASATRPQPVEAAWAKREAQDGWYDTHRDAYEDGFKDGHDAALAATAITQAREDGAAGGEDRARLDWLAGQAATGACPGLIFDDNGHWAVTFEGVQELLPGGDPQDLNTSFFVEAKDWRNSVRDAIDAARAREGGGG